MSLILIAEDDLTMRNFLGMALERAGHEVISCANGLEALAVLEQRNHHIDLLLADIVMPGMDGVELSQKAAVIQPDIKVMFITGFAGVIKGNDTPPPSNHVLSKPFHLKDLVDQVENLLEE